MPILTKNKLVETAHGKGGGYRLTRDPEEYTVGEILRLTEGTLAPIACVAEDAQPCARESSCRTIGFWKGLNEAVSEYVDHFTSADFLK